MFSTIHWTILAICFHIMFPHHVILRIKSDICKLKRVNKLYVFDAYKWEILVFPFTWIINNISGYLTYRTNCNKSNC